MTTRDTGLPVVKYSLPGVPDDYRTSISRSGTQNCSKNKKNNTKNECIHSNINRKITNKTLNGGYVVCWCFVMGVRGWTEVDVAVMQWVILVQDDPDLYQSWGLRGATRGRFCRDTPCTTILTNDHEGRSLHSGKNVACRVPIILSPSSRSHRSVNHHHMIPTEVMSSEYRAYIYRIYCDGHGSRVVQIGWLSGGGTSHSHKTKATVMVIEVNPKQHDNTIKK